MMKNKQTSSKSKKFVTAGGSGKMFKRTGSSTQKPGVSSQEGHSKGGKPKGGSTKMFGKQSASPVKPA